MMVSLCLECLFKDFLWTSGAKAIEEVLSCFYLNVYFISMATLLFKKVP